MNRGILSLLTATAMSAFAAGCTMSDTKAPPLQGPSELGLSITVQANPDVLSHDGASQAQITIEARDANGQLLANKSLRVEIVAENTFVDCGTLSARTIVTGSNGRATLTYTAPSPSCAPADGRITIVVTPTGTDASTALSRFITIRLVPPGVVIGGYPNPSFTFTPAAPAAFSDVRFDASASSAALGAGIASYTWDFGDGSTGSGVTASHRYAAGTYIVVLTVTDTNGLASSTSQTITVGPGLVPTADFNFSPQAPAMNQEINFNASASRPGPGHTIVRYDWNFGSGSPGTGVTITKSYDTSGIYNVSLTVTDESGQTAVITKQVTVGNTGGLTSSFTMSPSNPKIVPPTQVNYNGGPSSAPAGATITNYAWDFGDGFTASGVTTQHIYAAAATYIVRLTVTDSTGRTASSTQNLVVAP